MLKIVWPDSIVEESSLSQNISLIRKALGEDRDGRRFIETIPKRGYKFIAPVKLVNNRAAAGDVLPPQSGETETAFMEKEGGARHTHQQGEIQLQTDPQPTCNHILPSREVHGVVVIVFMLPTGRGNEPV
ncbi:MAG: winged helix-turn-helix domain-containing protein [Blastocatellia bacterium]|nr:winged helix-turn-helix domain-containing protein [Blastocatellia bacterium]